MPSTDWYADHLAQLRSKPNPTEADVSMALVRPVLERELGFGVAQIDAEAASLTGNRLRPDLICGELAGLLTAMRAEAPIRRPTVSADGKVVTFQPTGMYFISSLPAGVLDRYAPRKRPDAGRKAHTLASDGFYWPWIGLYNSHLFHAYWLMVGDAFHITREYETVKRPPGWDDESLRAETERTARQLMHRKTLDACHVVVKMFGEHHNVNFHKPGTPGLAIIEKLDGLLLEAYGLAVHPLMEQMRVIRAASAHMLGERAT